eukprot:PITA_02300
MVEEYDSIVRNSVWDMVLRLENKSIVSSRWLYKVKQDADGSVEKHKARFITRGFSQVEGIDYDETFAPVARIDNYFIGLGFTKSEVGANLYHIVVKGKVLIVILYVDDLILTSDDQLIVSCKEDLAREFEMKDMGSFITSLAWKYGRRMGSCLCLRENWAGSPSDHKSTSGGIFNLESTTVSWYSRKHRSVALSSAEVEYMAAIQVACEAIWMWTILVGLFDQRKDPIVIYCANQSCIKLSENLVFHDRSKHIDIRYHHLRDCVARGIMLLQYISTEEQDVDI